MSYPQHMRLKTVQRESQAQGRFLEWLLKDKGYALAATHVHTEECDLFSGRYRCGRADELEAVQARTETLLAEYHGIDLQKLEEEKLAMLEELRRTQEKAP